MSWQRLLNLFHVMRRYASRYDVPNSLFAQSTPRNIKVPRTQRKIYSLDVKIIAIGSI
jgi:hypothetical protein